jgi:hypothetical protein
MAFGNDRMGPKSTTNKQSATTSQTPGKQTLTQGIANTIPGPGKAFLAAVVFGVTGIRGHAR